MRSSARIVVLSALALLLPASLFAAGAQESADFSYPNRSELSIDAAVFQLEFVASTDNSITLLKSSVPNGYTLEHSLQGDRVHVVLQHPLVSLPSWGSSRARLRIAVPATGVTLSASTSTGSISASNLDGSLDFTTSTGAIRIETSRGRLRTRSRTGAQDISLCEGILEARSTTGGIAIDGFSGRITAATTTGAIRGSRIRLQDDAEFTTATGAIAMDFLNDVNQLSFRLQSSTGSVRIGTTRQGSGRISIPGTGITVYGTSTTGSQHYY